MTHPGSALARATIPAYGGHGPCRVDRPIGCQPPASAAAELPGASESSSAMASARRRRRRGGARAARRPGRRRGRRAQPEEIPKGIADSKLLQPRRARGDLRSALRGRRKSPSPSARSRRSTASTSCRRRSSPCAAPCAAWRARADAVLIDGNVVPPGAALRGARRSSTATRSRSRSPPPRSSPRSSATG